MEYPSADSAAAFLFRVEGDPVAESSWDPAFGVFSLESIFSSQQEPDHHSNRNAGNAPANPSIRHTIVSPPTCGSQAARAASRVGAGIDPTPNPLPAADLRWPAPVAAQIAAPVPPSDLRRIARLFAANAASRPPARSSKTALSSQRPTGVDGADRADLGDSGNWGSLPVDSAPDAPYPAQRTPGNTRALGFLSALGGPDTVFGPFPPSSAADPQWTAAGTTGLNTGPGASALFPPSPRDFDTTFDSFKFQSSDYGSGSSSINYTVPSWPAPHHPLSPIPHEHRTVASDDHEGRVSIVPSVPNPVGPYPSPPKSRPPGRAPKRSSSPLAIVQYNPGDGSEARTLKKRPAFDDITPQGMTSKTLRKVLVHDDQGEVKGTMMTFGNRVKTRAVFSEEKRQRTAQARREGVCSRCRKSKRQCDLAHQQSLYVSCTLCAGTKLYKNAPRHPCFKATLEDILFFRSGPASNEPFFTKRRLVYDLQDLSEPEVSVRTLKLTQHIGSHQLTVYVSEFNPLPDDVTSYTWHDSTGQSHELNMPTFCLTNIPKIDAHLRQYVSAAKWSYLHSLQEDDELAWMTVSTAMGYAKANPNSLVADALDLWAISRVIETPWEMCGDDTLGVSRIQDASSPHNGKIPIPPIMDTQLDQIVIQHMLNPLRAVVIEKFEQLITPAKPEAWWEVYLSAFILLSHIEHLAKHSADHARTHTMPGKYSNIPFLEGVFHTAKSILARFHFVCNGSAPLRLDWSSPKVAAMAQLEPDQVQFMKRTQAMIASREADVLNLRATHQYGKTLHWAGQLFYGDFDTSPVHVVEELDEDGE